MPDVGKFLEWKVDASALKAALEERIKYRGSRIRTFAQIVNHALYSIAVKAQRYTPKATPDTIDTSLNVTVNFVINKKGNRVPKRKPHTFNYGPGSVQTSVPLAKLIVLARADISKQGRLTGRSNYNTITNDRWWLPKATLKGGRAKILAMMDRMVKARHSSGALLKAGWGPAIKILFPFVVRSESVVVGKGEQFDYSKNQQRLGTAFPAKDGWVCKGRIENNVGGDEAGPLGARQRDALIRYGSAAAERAVAEEAASTYAYIQKQLDKEVAVFNAKVK